MPNQTYAAGNAYEYNGSYSGSVSASAAGRAGARTGAAVRPENRVRTREAQGRRRSVSRAPDMSAPRAKAKSPSVSIGLGESVGVSAQTKTAAKTAAPQVRTVKRTASVPIPLGFIMTAVFCTLLFMYMIFNFVRINESTIRVSALRTQLSGLISEESDLTLRLEQKNNLTAIEEYAVSVLGMVKNDQLPKRYVNIDSVDKIEAAIEEDGTDTGVFASAFDAFRERIDEIMEYIG